MAERDGEILIRGSAEFETVDGKSYANYHGKRIESTAETPVAITGTASVIHPADWNGDGRLDLLVGDFASQIPDLPEPTPEQKIEHERIRKELEPLQARYGQLFRKIDGPERVRTNEERDKVQKEMQEVYEQMHTLRSKLPVEHENHGWVWLFLRK